MKRKLILLDRDGVINEDSDDYIKNPDEWQAIPGSLEAIAALNSAGYYVIIVTNQSGVGRNFFTMNTLNKIHEKLHRELENLGGKIADIYVCPHTPYDKCDCRKPQLKLFRQIQKKYGCDLKDVYFIGDSMSDMQAALSLPCKPILVLTGKGVKTLASHPNFNAIPCYSNLASAVREILKQEQTGIK